MMPESHEPPTATERNATTQFVLGLLGLILLLDLVLAAIPRQARGMVESPAGVRDAIALAAADDDVAWLLLGDSVLVGNTGRAELPDWYDHRLIDYLEHELGEHEAVGFHQVALSGLLPVDMLALVDELERRDPGGKVGLVIEVSPRYFSPIYAEQTEHSRPWLAELGGPPRLGLGAIDATLRWLRRVTPVYRHRILFEEAREDLAPPGFARPNFQAENSDVEAQRGSQLEALARLRVHYRDPQFEPGGAQADALRSIIERSRRSGRKVVVFATPIEDEFHGGLLDEQEQGAYIGGLAELIEPDGRDVAFLPMDHPIFTSGMFWDHVHLRPEGHRLLALNLVQQMGLGLQRLPAREELIGGPGVDASLVARIDSGYADGAAWQARFDHPAGLAVSTDGQRLIVADTRNHVLRELVGDMRVVRTIAGKAGEPGSADGSDARLDRPSAVVVVGGEVWFADAGGGLLRRLDAGKVETLLELEGWRIEVLRSDGERIYMLQSRGRQTRIASTDRAGGEATTHISANEDTALSAFALDPRGGIYVATDAGRILHGKEVDGAERGLDALVTIYANEATEILPQGKSETFPHTFDKIKFTNIVDLQYVDRYHGLLVQDLVPHGAGEYDQPVTERAHLRFLDLDKRLVQPWLKPLVSGIGYFYLNKSTGGFSSYYHEGALALHQASATLFLVEHERSRLLRLDDGLLGLSKIGHVNHSKLGFRDVLTSNAGQRAFADHRPDQHFDERLELLRLRETYSCLLIGSSLQAMSDISGQYSLARRLAQGIARDLALRDRVALEVFHRTIPGGSLPSQVKAVANFIREGGRPDVIIIEANASTFLDPEDDDAFILEQFEVLEKHARKGDSILILLDAVPYVARNRDALRSGPDNVARLLELARARGIHVVSVGDLALDAHLEISPFASPPMEDIHLAPWAIDVVADMMASALAPVLRLELRGRRPSRSRASGSHEKPSAKSLADAFGEDARTWAAALPRPPAAALQSTQAEGHLEVFIDLGQLPEEFAVDEQDLDPIVIACLYEFSLRRMTGAQTASVKVVRFGRYDEYGAGVAEGASVLRSEEFTRDSLAKLLRSYAKRMPDR